MVIFGKIPNNYKENPPVKPNSVLHSNWRTVVVPLSFRIALLQETYSELLSAKEKCLAERRHVFPRLSVRGSGGANNRESSTLFNPNLKIYKALLKSELIQELFYESKTGFKRGQDPISRIPGGNRVSVKVDKLNDHMGISV